MTSRPLVDFIILTTARTGSTYLRQTLNSHPAIHCEGELFGHVVFPNAVQVWNKQLRNPNDLKYRFTGRENKCIYLAKSTWNLLIKLVTFALTKWRNLRPFYYLERCREQKPEADYFGFKMLAFQHSGLVLLPELKPARFIYLERRNIVKQAISFELALKRNVWQAMDKLHITDHKFSIPPRRVLTHIRQIKAQHEKLKKILNQHNAEVLYLTYEELFADMEGSLRKLADFFQVAPEGFNLQAVSIVKLNPQNLREVLANYDEIHQALDLPELQAMLADIGL